MKDNILHLTALRKTSKNSGVCRLSCDVRLGPAAPVELWYELPEERAEYFESTLFDPFLAAALLPAMRMGCDIKVDGPCSPVLVEHALGPIMDLWLSSFPELFRRIRVSTGAPGSPSIRDAKKGSTACFFSCGVDSFYTVINNQENPALPITHLVTVHGFDVRLTSHPSHFEKIEQHVKRFGEEHGLNYLFVRTNIREWSDGFLNWELYHGAAMASAGLALAGRLSTFLIASGTGAQKRWGSHPDLDPLWGNGRVEFIHDVIGVKRIDKIRTILKWEDVLQHLRVCWENPQGIYNCSRCEKCLRTMMSLWILEADKRAETFEWDGVAGKVLRLRIEKRCRHHWRTILRTLPTTPEGFMFKGVVLLVLIRSGSLDALRHLRNALTGRKK